VAFFLPDCWITLVDIVENCALMSSTRLRQKNSLAESLLILPPMILLLMKGLADVDDMI
jgi:hypothetical protein